MKMIKKLKCRLLGCKLKPLARYGVHTDLNVVVEWDADLEKLAKMYVEADDCKEFSET